MFLQHYEVSFQSKDGQYKTTEYYYKKFFHSMSNFILMLQNEVKESNKNYKPDLMLVSIKRIY